MGDICFMMHEENIFRRKNEAKSVIAFRVAIAFALAAILIPVYVIAIIKVIEAIKS